MRFLIQIRFAAVRRCGPGTRERSLSHRQWAGTLFALYTPVYSLPWHFARFASLAGVAGPCGRFCLFGLALAALFVAPALVRAGEKNPGTPVITVRIRSLDTVDRSLVLLSRLTGIHHADQWFGPPHHQVALKDLKGWDFKRPLGLYVFGGKQFEWGNSPVVFVFPVTDEKQFLEMLHRLGSKRPRATTIICIGSNARKPRQKAICGSRTAMRISPWVVPVTSPGIAC